MPEHANIKDRLVGAFSSLRLAVVLLIIMATVSVVGTLVPQEQLPLFYIRRYGQDTYHYLKLMGVIDLYHSWGFRALMGLLCVNLTVCTARRLKGVYRRTMTPVVERAEHEITAMRISNTLPLPERADVLTRALSEKGYRIRQAGRCVHGAKGIAGPWGDMITHASILLIMLGALAGSLGHVGTVNVYEGGSAVEYYNWNDTADRPLGFELCVDKFTLQFYPAHLRIEARNRGTGMKAGLFDTREGGAFMLPGTEYLIVPERMDQDKGEVTLKVYDGGRLAGVYDTAVEDGGPTAPPLFDYSFDLVSHEAPILKDVASTVRMVRGGVTLDRGIVSINNPLKFEGLSIYQTSYDRDEDGRYYSGFQIVRDPGIPLVWSGFVLLLAGLVLSFGFHHRQVWVYVGDDRSVIGGSTSKDWKGFMREYSGIVKTFMQEVEP